MTAKKINYNKKFLCIIDVNYNRAKEGLRVVEDIFRFIHKNDRIRQKTRTIRHAINQFIDYTLRIQAISTRDSAKDIGRAVDHFETKRTDEKDILLANLQRVKESLRVLEECLKTVAPDSFAGIKNLRYKTYTLEKEILSTIYNIK